MLQQYVPETEVQKIQRKATDAAKRHPVKITLLAGGCFAFGTFNVYQWFERKLSSENGPTYEWTYKEAGEEEEEGEQIVIKCKDLASVADNTDTTKDEAYKLKTENKDYVRKLALKYALWQTTVQPPSNNYDVAAALRGAIANANAETIKTFEETMGYFLLKADIKKRYKFASLRNAADEKFVKFVDHCVFGTDTPSFTEFLQDQTKDVSTPKNSDKKTKQCGNETCKEGQWCQKTSTQEAGRLKAKFYSFYKTTKESNYIISETDAKCVTEPKPTEAMGDKCVPADPKRPLAEKPLCCYEKKDEENEKKDKNLIQEYECFNY